MTLASSTKPFVDAIEIPSPETKLSRFGWGVLAYTIAVVLFGAVVRITGSGAGCGQHWPTCQGEVLHVPTSMHTAIELSHRLTSGLSLMLVIALSVGAFRIFPAGHPARRRAVASVVLMGTESLVGAALVLLRLVGQNTSTARAAVMSVHLVNTSFLTGAIALTAWTATRTGPRRLRPVRRVEWALLSGLVGALAVMITGAITALGDTLYPVEAARGLTERLAQDQVATASFLERGRAVHPAVAFVVAILLLGIAWKIPEQRSSPEIATAARRVAALVFIQVGVGVLNVALSAPGWMQVIHLMTGTLLWLALVLLYATVRADDERTVVA